MVTLLAPMVPALLVLLEGEEEGGGGLFGSFAFPLVLMGLIFWFVVFGPERKQRKKREQMLEQLKKGDDVLTTSGIYGRVVQVKGDVVTVQVDDKVRLKMARAAIQGQLREDPGTGPDDDEDAGSGEATKPEEAAAS